MKDRLGALPAVASASEPVAVAHRTKGLDKWTVCVCLFCGTYYTLAGMLLFFVPRFFFTKLAPFAPYNEHYMVDLGSFLLPVGLFLLRAQFVQTIGNEASTEVVGGNCCTTTFCSALVHNNLATSACR